MRRFMVLVVATAALLTAAPLAAQPQSRNASRERRIEEALASVSPASLPAFRRATEAMDAGKPAEAEPLYKEVLAAAPAFTPAMRRLGYVLIAVGRDDEGLVLLQQAVQIDRSPENLISLATRLAHRADGKTMRSADERRTALSLAKEAARTNRESDDESFHATVAQLALGLDDSRSFREAVDALTTRHPQKLATHYFSAILSPVELTVASSAGVVNTRDTRPPATGTEYSSLIPPVGNWTWMARSCRVALKSTARSSAVNELGISRVE
jgi:tetratricopeptide (TPR) repeat protein